MHSVYHQQILFLKFQKDKTVHKLADESCLYTLTNGIIHGPNLMKTIVLCVVPGHVAMAFPSLSLLGVPLGPLVFLPHHMHACSSGCKKDETSFPEWKRGEAGRKDATERKHTSARVGVGNFEYEFKFNTFSLLKAGKSWWTTSYVYFFLVSKQLVFI